VAVLGTHLCGLFGINLCYHRLLTHRGLKCPKWLEHAMVIVAMSCFQETPPAGWLSTAAPSIRRPAAGPHSPLASFSGATSDGFWSTSRNSRACEFTKRYAKDILRDRFYVALERNHWLVWINLGQIPLFFGAGFAVAWLSGETPDAAAQTGLGIMMFGVFVRTVLVWQYHLGR